MVAIARPLPRQRTLPTWIRPWMRTKIYIGGGIVFLLILLGIIGPLIAPFNPSEQQLRESLRMPQWFAGSHFLGTDNLGRDIMSRLLYGARVSLIIAFTVVIISGFVGISLGAISGSFGDKVDFIIQKFVEVVWAFPALLLAIAILAYLGQGLQN